MTNFAGGELFTASLAAASTLLVASRVARISPVDRRCA
jgi:hypothetical protein